MKIAKLNIALSCIALVLLCALPGYAWGQVTQHTGKIVFRAPNGVSSVYSFIDDGMPCETGNMRDCRSDVDWITPNGYAELDFDNGAVLYVNQVYAVNISIAGKKDMRSLIADDSLLTVAEKKDLDHFIATDVLFTALRYRFGFGDTFSNAMAKRSFPTTFPYTLGNPNDQGVQTMCWKGIYMFSRNPDVKTFCLPIAFEHGTLHDLYPKQNYTKGSPGFLAVIK